MQSTSRGGLLVLAASVAALAGGTGTETRLGYSDQTTLYYPELVGQAATKGELPTVIRGNPFGNSLGDPQAIAAAIRPPARYSSVHLSTNPQLVSPDGYRLVLIFDPPVNAPSGDLACRDKDAAEGGNSAGPVRVQASFCIGNRLASQVTGTGAPASSPDAPAFQSLMGQVMEVMFPPIKRDIGDGTQFPK